MESRENGRGENERITDEAIEGRPVRGSLPQGRRAGAKRPNVLLVAVILWQSAGSGYDRQQCRTNHRIKGMCGENPPGWICVRLLCPVCAIVTKGDPRAAPRAPATVTGQQIGAAIPSLRTHKPILPGAILRDHAGEILENRTLAALQRPQIVLWPRKRPNLVRTSSKNSGETSVDEPAHADIHCHAQRQERKQHRRSTVAH